MRVLVSILLLAMTGCGTFLAHTDLTDDSGKAPYQTGVYAGVRLDAEFVHDTWSPHNGEDTADRIFLTPIILLDMPFSAIADTVLLPFDLTRK